MALAVLAIASLAASTSHAQTLPPAIGDWVVADNTTIADASIVVKGSLTVASGGKLTLADVDLVFACSAYQPGILVEASGELVIKDQDGDPASTGDATQVSNIDPSQDFNLTYTEGSRGLISCSRFKGVSIHVLADSLTITGSTIEEGRIGGVGARGCALTIEDTELRYNSFWGVSVSGGSLRMEGCYLNETVGIGAVVDSGVNAHIDNCSFYLTTAYGVRAASSMVIIEDCTFIGGDYGMVLEDLSNCTIRRCSFVEILYPNHRGIHATGVDQLLVTECEFVHVSGDAAIFLNGTGAVDRCTIVTSRMGISISAGSFLVEQCNLSGNRIGIKVQNSRWGMATIEGCTINDSQEAAINVEGTQGAIARATLRNCTILHSRWQGVLVAHGSVLMDGCTLSDCFYGLDLEAGSDAHVGNCTFNDCITTGIRSRYSNSVVEDSLFAGSIFGCDFLGAANGTLRRCRFDDTGSPIGCGLLAACTGQLNVTQCEFALINCTAASVIGAVAFDGTDVTGCRRGILIGNGSIDLTRCRFDSNEVGAWVMQSSERTATFEGCTFVGNVQCGLLIESEDGNPTSALLRNCTFDRNVRYGVQVGEEGRCVLVDPRLSDDGIAGIRCARNSTIEWKVEGTSSVTNDTCDLRGNVTVGPHGTLGLANASLQFMYEDGVAYGALVKGGKLVLTDLDEDPITRTDASSVRGEEHHAFEGSRAFVSVTDGGDLVARGARFSALTVTVEGARCELSDCEFMGVQDVALALGNTTGPSVLHACDFSMFSCCVRAWNTHLAIEGCTFRLCAVCVEADHCDGLSITDSTLITVWKGLDIESVAVVILDNVSIFEGESGITMSNVGDLTISGVVVSGCSNYGMSFVRCNVSIYSLTIRAIGEVGMSTDRCNVSIDDVVIRGCGGSGLRMLQGTLSGVALRVNETDDRAAEFSGGTVDLTDSYLDSLGDAVLLATGDAIVRCYNTTIEGLRVDVRDDAVVEMYHQVRVTVTLMDGGRPPRTLWIAITSAQGIRALSMPLGRYATTGWVWLEQLAIIANGTVWHTPYVAEVSLGGRSVTQGFEVRGRTDVIIELRHEVVAAISAQGEVREGTEATLDGTASSSWPFDIALAEWDIDYDGVFSPDGWGERLWWTFDANGTRKVALRVTDETGLGAIAVAVVVVLDAGPSVIIVPPPPGSVLEDELFQMDGRVASPADVVEYIAWDLGDGRVVEGRAPFVSWPRAGTYVVTFTAVDMDGSRATAHATMTVVNQPPVAVVPRVRLEAGRHVPFVLDGSRSHDTPSDMASLAFGWIVEGVGTFAGVRPNVTFDAVGEFRVTLTVTDDDGSSSSAVMTIVVVNAPPIVGRLDDISVRQTDGPLGIPLGGRVTDPDDDARNITVRATSSRPDLVGVEVRRLDDGTYVLTVTAIGTGGAVGRAVVTVTATDRDGGTAEGAFNITLLKAPETVPEEKPAWVVPSLVLSLILVLVAVVLLLSWARARRGGRLDGAS